jgi:hypothetical protein
MTRRLAAMSAVFAACAVVLAALAAGQRGDADGSAAKPRLSVDLAPFAVGGSGFRAGETVRITVRGAVTSSRKAKASAAGRISLRFPGLRVDDCGPGFLIITATGDMGSRAQLRRMPPACGIDPGRAS